MITTTVELSLTPRRWAALRRDPNVLGVVRWEAEDAIRQCQSKWGGAFDSYCCRVLSPDGSLVEEVRWAPLGCLPMARANLRRVKRVEPVASRVPSVQALVLEGRPGICPLCDEPMPPGRRRRPRVHCGAAECTRLYLYLAQHHRDAVMAETP